MAAAFRSNVPATNHEVSADIVAGRLVIAPMPALPIRNRRRDAEGSAGGASVGTSPVPGLKVDIEYLLETT
jgi:hypothetical protein